MLDALLVDLGRQAYGGEVEIVVVEETDDPRAPEGVNYVPLPVRNLGIAYARNRALSEANHELVVYVDDDCRVESDWLEKLLAPFADTHVLGVQGGVTVPEGTNAIGWAETLLGFPGGGIGRIHRAAGQWQETIEVSTLNAAYRREAIEQAGGFSEEARFGGEDDLLAKQVAKHGKLLFVPEARVAHLARGSFAAIWHWFVRRGKSEVGLLRAGLARDGYLAFMLRSSLGLKLSITLLTVPWFGGLFPVLLLLAVTGVTWWRLRWAFKNSTTRAGAILAPLVRMTMDLAVDAGSLRALAGR